MALAAWAIARQLESAPPRLAHLSQILASFVSCFGLSLTESLGFAQYNMRLGNYIACRLCRVLDGSLFVRTQGVGVLRSHLPTSLFEHLSMGQASHPPTWGTTLSVQSVLSCPLWPCAHRVCVIAKETGLSPMARTCSKTRAFPLTSENHEWFYTLRQNTTELWIPSDHVQ